MGFTAAIYNAFLLFILKKKTFYYYWVNKIRQLALENTQNITPSIIVPSDCKMNSTQIAQFWRPNENFHFL